MRDILTTKKIEAYIHITKPVKLKVINGGRAPCEVVNPAFLAHEKMIAEEIEKQNILMKPCGDYPYKKTGALL